MHATSRIALAAIIFAAPVAAARAVTQHQSETTHAPTAAGQLAEPMLRANPGIGMAQADTSDEQWAQSDEENDGGAAGPAMMGSGMMGPGMMGPGMMHGGMMGPGMGGMKPMMRMMQGMMQMMQGMMEMMAHPAGFPAARGMMMRGQFVEEHLAALKSGLGITEAQMPQWNAFADAVRARVKAMRTMAGQMLMAHRAAPMSWPDRLAQHEQRLTARLDGLKAMEGPTKALWDALSEEQRNRAEDLMPGPMWMR